MSPSRRKSEVGMTEEDHMSWSLRDVEVLGGRWMRQGSKGGGSVPAIQKDERTI